MVNTKQIQGARRIVTELLHWPSVAILFGTGILFSGLILVEFYDVVVSVFDGSGDLMSVLERVFLLLLYVEVVASIKIYFAENFHFPLRFFLYIGITHMIRYIIISHESGMEVLLLTLALLVLVVSLSVLEIKSHYLYRKFKADDSSRLEL